MQGSDSEWFLGDALGSVRQVVDSSGSVVLSRDYDPYGQVTAEGGTGSSGYGFTGEQYDLYVKYVYLRARWYSPYLNRFLSQDPWSGSIYQPSSLHKYLYVGDNPINLIDPSGLYEKDVHLNWTTKWAYYAAHGSCPLNPEQGPCWPNSERASMYAKEIAQADQHVDNLWSGMSPVPSFGQPRKMHFATRGEAEQAIESAIENAEGFEEYDKRARQALRKFGYALHMLEDTYSHWGEGYVYGWDYPNEDLPPVVMERSGHAQHSFRLGNRWQHLGIGLALDGWRQELKALYPEARNRIDKLSRDEIVDLWIREQGVTEDAKLHRYIYGYKTDRYFEFSERDKEMREATLNALKKFFDAFGCPGPQICD
jgi:RHS repeat-associated protein